MNAFVQHFGFDFRTGLRNKSLLLLNYLFPLGFYAMMGLLMCNINPLFTETMIPAMVVFTVLSSAVLGLPSPLVEAREAGILRSYRINGVPALSILAIPALTTAFHALITSAIITATAGPLFDVPLPVGWPAMVGVSLLVAFACAGLGMLIGVISANSQLTILWSQLIYLPSMMLSGMMVPMSMLPKALATVARLLPPTYAMQAYQGLAYGRPAEIDPRACVAVLLTGGVLAFVLAILLFNWDSRNETRRLHPALAALALLPYALGAALL